MTPNCYYQLMGEVNGPVSTDEIRELARRRIIERDTLLRIGSDSEWFPASRVKNLFTVASIGGSEGGISSEIQSPIPRFTATPEVIVADTDRSVSSQRIQSKVPRKLRQLIHDNEEILFAGHPSINALIVQFVLVAFFGVLVIVSQIMIDEALRAVGPLLLTVIAMVIAYIHWRNQFYLITSRRTISKQGIFNVAIKILPNHNIQMISINTGIIDRLIGSNSIELSSAASNSSGGILRFFPGFIGGGVIVRWVDLSRILPLYGK